jgi:hypothetical protein
MNVDFLSQHNAAGVNVTIPWRFLFLSELLPVLLVLRQRRLIVHNVFAHGQIACEYLMARAGAN